WGLLRSVRAEYPDRVIRLLDLDTTTHEDDIETAVNASGEPELAIRHGEIRTARLQHLMEPNSTDLTAPHISGSATTFDAEGAVLVTGGAGELGRAVALRLVERFGVRHLVLTSRRGLEAAGARELVARLERAG
ncbi:KR domain-containing protein, partial [Streptomyces sp. DT73]